MSNNQFRTGRVVRGDSLYLFIERAADHVWNGIMCYSSVWKDVETFTHPLPSPYPHLLLLGLFLPSPLLGWIFLRRQCGESIFYKLVLYIVTMWFCLLPVAMGCSHSHFDPYGIYLTLPSKQSSANVVPQVLFVIWSSERHKYFFLKAFFFPKSKLCMVTVYHFLLLNRDVLRHVLWLITWNNTETDKKQNW